jgi:aminoglycoside phosphotransferase (APT) family kinase protein
VLTRNDLQTIADQVTDLVGPSDASEWVIAGEGFESVAYEVRGWIVRIAKHAEVRAGHEREVRLLPAVAKYLPVPVPANPVLLGPGEGMPFGAMAYRALPGRTMKPEDGKRTPALALSVANMLGALHTFPISEAEELGVLRYGPRGDLPRIRGETEEFLLSELDPKSSEMLDSWWDWPARFLSFEPRLCHCDAWFENLLVDEPGAKLVGLIDFEGASIGDAALDLAPVFHMGSRFGEAVVRRVNELDGDDPNLRARTERHRLLRWLDFLGFVLDQGWEKEVSDAVGKIKEALPSQPI